MTNANVLMGNVMYELNLVYLSLSIINDCLWVFLIFIIIIFGLYRTNAVAYTNAHFGQGSVPILLSELGCTGTEKDLFYCYFKPLGTVNCHHYEDAGVICGKQC